MKVGIVIHSGDPETVWNALRFANFTLSLGDEVRLFLIGKGVEAAAPKLLDTEKFRVSEQLEAALRPGGKVFACGTCLELHHLKAPEGFIVATLKDLYEIVKENDKIVTF